VEPGKIEEGCRAGMRDGRRKPGLARYLPGDYHQRIVIVSGTSIVLPFRFLFFPRLASLAGPPHTHWSPLICIIFHATRGVE